MDTQKSANMSVSVAEPDADQREMLLARQVMADADFQPQTVCLVILTGLAVFYTLYFAAGIILPFVLALMLSLLLTPVAHFLVEKLRLPRMMAALLLILALFSAVGGLGYAITVPATGWIAKAPQSLPMLQQKLGFLRRPIAMFTGGMRTFESLMRDNGQAGSAPDSSTGQASQSAPPPDPTPAPNQDAAPKQPAAQSAEAGHAQAPNDQAPPAQKAPAQATSSQAPPPATPSAGSGASAVGQVLFDGTRSFLGQSFTLVIILFFLLADGDNLLRRFIEILPGLKEKKRTLQIVRQLGGNISGYLATITMMNAAVGVAAGLSIWAFGLPDPLLWGTVAFLLNYIPILGALTGIVIFLLVGLFSYSDPIWALGPAGAYLIIHLVEGETVTPMLLARRFTLNPLLVIAGLMFWDWLWGVPGALLAVPLLAAFKIFCDHIEALTPIGHMLGTEPVTRARASD